MFSALWDNVTDLVLDRENNGNWVGVVFVIAFIVLVVWWVDNKLSISDHNAELTAATEQHNSERAKILKQLKLRDKELEARDAEIKWAREREQHHINEREKLEAKNAELSELLNTKLPADLYR